MVKGPPMSAFEPGAILHAKYRIERTLGTGGMGVVLLATHLRLEQRVAIKIIRRSDGDGASLAKRFAREARIAARLRGEHAVRILDVDDSDSGETFLVMEYLEGTDLARLLEAESAPLAVARAVGYVLQACEGVAEAHALGIVHRDVKPANLFLTKRLDGTELVKLLDFGISKAMAPPPHELAVTRPRVAIGSPSYMSPEQLEDSGDVDARTDIWALGVVLYELLARRLPFEATTPATLAVRIATVAPPSLRLVRPDLPEGLEAVVLRCLEKQPAKRFPSVVDVARALAPFAPESATWTERAIRTATADEASSAPPAPNATGQPARDVTAPIAITRAPSGEPESPLLRAMGSEAAPPIAELLERTSSRWRRPLVTAAGIVALVAAGIVALRRPAPGSAGVCATYVVAGDTHTCIRLSDGSLRCWGDNRYGQLGTGDTAPSPTARTVPLESVSKIFLPVGQGDLTLDVADFSCAVTTTNALYCWGDNRWGAFGPLGDRALSPVEVRVPGTLSHASVGAGHVCALAADGSIACFGNDASGQVGRDGPKSQPVPFVVPGLVADKIVTGGSHTCARRPDGTMLCWGANDYGQLGNGSTTATAQPTEVLALAKRVVRLAAGANHTCAQTSEGELHCWGDNRYGQLGTGDRTRTLEPKKVSGTADAASKVFAGGGHSCAIHADGSFWCWGDNRSGQLGTGDIEPRLTATRVDALGNDVAAANAGGAHTCVVKTDGSVWCWGNNQYGQVGAGVGSKATSPVRIVVPCR
jgi:serine/threonine-protein kinase